MDLPGGKLGALGPWTAASGLSGRLCSGAQRAAALAAPVAAGGEKVATPAAFLLPTV